MLHEMDRMFIYFFILHAATIIYGDEIVYTPSGPITGRKIVAANGQEIITFQGIPYAKAPTGTRRFQYPVELKRWADEAQNASRYDSVVCMQNEMLLIVGVENCLHLEIFTPSANKSEKLPVFVWIHDHHAVGGLSSMTPESGYANNIATRGVIAVTLNFRLAVLALNETADLGFKDQQMALVWIQNNIQYFNGDPKRVTIAGVGSGAEYVRRHLLSPSSTDLFTAAILQSGRYAIRRFVPCTAVYQLRKAIGCEEKSFSCLYYKSAEALLNITKNMDFQTCLNNSDLSTVVLNKVPIIIGATRDEWGYYDMLKLLYDSGFYDSVNESYFMERLNSITYAVARNESERDHLKAILQHAYLDKKESWFAKTIQLETDVHFFGPLMEVIQQMQGTPVYLYLFDHVSPAEMTDLPWRGAIHLSDMQYLFAQPGKSVANMLTFKPTTSDVALVGTIGALWTNFVKYHNPTPRSSLLQWPPISEPQNNRQENVKFLRLAAVPSIGSHFNYTTLHLWERVVPPLLKPLDSGTCASSILYFCFGFRTVYFIVPFLMHYQISVFQI